MTESDQIQSRTHQPNIVSAVCSLALLPTWSCAGLFFASMWLAFCEGCDSKIRYPIDDFGGPDLLDAALLNGNYLYGAAIGSLVLFIGLTRVRWPVRVYIGAIWVTFIAILCYAVAVAQWEWEGLGLAIASILPIVVLMLWSVWDSIVSKDWLKLTTVLQSWNMTASLFLIWVRVLFARSLLIGFWVGLIFSIALIPAAWLFYHRLEHDVFDQRVSIRPWKLSVRQLLIWSCILPLLFSYYGWLNHFRTDRHNGTTTEVKGSE